MIEIRIPDVGPSLNTFYSGMDKFKRMKLVKQWHTLVICEAKRQRIPKIKDYPVDIEITCFFGKGRKIQDSDNLALTGKVCTDGLVQCGVLAGDSPRYVSSVRFTPLRSSDGKTYTIVRLKNRVAETA